MKLKCEKLAGTIGRYVLLWLLVSTLQSCTAVMNSFSSNYVVTGIFGEPKANGYLLKIEATGRIKHVEAWIGENKWVYVTIPDTNVDETRLKSLKHDSIVKGIKLFRYKDSVQLSVQLSESFSHVDVVRYPNNNNIYVILFKEQQGT